MTDDLKKPTPQSAFKPVGTYRGTEPKGTVPVDLPPSWAIALSEKIEGVSKSQSNMSNAVGEFGSKLGRFESALELVRGEVHELRTWKKSVGDSGMMPPFVRPDGPKPTISGEVRRVSENDMKQDADIGLAKGDIAAIREEVKEIKNEVTGLKDTQARQTNNISAIKETNLEVKAAVTGFFRQHPELTGGLATLLGVIITLLTAWFQARVHQ